MKKFQRNIDLADLWYKFGVNAEAQINTKNMEFWNLIKTVDIVRAKMLLANQ